VNGDEVAGAGDVAIVVAAYNEAERIGATLAVLERVFPGAEIWVADDGSVDATAAIARAAGARVVRSERVIGKGAAVTRTVREALREACSRAHPQAREHVESDERNGESNGLNGESDELERENVEPNGEPIFVLCDGDLAESAGELAPLVEAVRHGQAELAVASFTRRLGGGVGLAVGFARWAIRRRCGLDTRAPISGQRALSARALADVLPFAPGFGMEIGMTIDAVRAGRRVTEVELDLAHRVTGRTLSGFLHRGRQLIDFVRVYLARR
jgi:Glycosyl transferase family 2